MIHTVSVITASNRYFCPIQRAHPVKAYWGPSCKKLLGIAPIERAAVLVSLWQGLVRDRVRAGDLKAFVREQPVLGKMSEVRRREGSRVSSHRESSKVFNHSCST